MSTALPTPMPFAVRLRLWARATRPPALLSSLIPCLAGGLVAIGSGRATWSLLVLASLAMLVLHAGVDISNDVEDAARGVDDPDKERNSRVFNTGLLSVREGRRLYTACFLSALILGLVICAIQGPALLIIGILGIAGGVGYTAGPWPYKYAGLGEPAIVLLMGPLITQGSYTAVTGDGFAAAAFWLGAGPGLLITCVLAANNIEDILDDGAKGVRTVAVRIGFDRARLLYCGCLFAIVPCQIVLWVSGLFDAWILLPLLVLPVMMQRAREALGAAGPMDSGLTELTGRTGQLHVLFSALLCVAVVLARLL